MSILLGLAPGLAQDRGVIRYAWVGPFFECVFSKRFGVLRKAKGVMAAPGLAQDRRVIFLRRPCLPPGQPQDRGHTLAVITPGLAHVGRARHRLRAHTTARTTDGRCRSVPSPAGVGTRPRATRTGQGRAQNGGRAGGPAGGGPAGGRFTGTYDEAHYHFPFAAAALFTHAAIEQRRMQRMCSGNPPQHAEPSIMRGQSWSASKHDQRATSTHKHAHVEAVHAGPVLVGVSARPLRHLDLTTFVRSRLSLCTPLQSESSHQNTTDKVRVFEPLVPFSVLHISHFCESSFHFWVQHRPGCNPDRTGSSSSNHSTARLPPLRWKLMLCLPSGSSGRRRSTTTCTLC